jgi:hypothetical protein
LKPLVIGIVLAIVILAGGFLVPALLPHATSPSTVQALREAELARRQVHAYDASLPLAAGRANVTELKQADFERLVERSQVELDTLRSESSRQVNRMKSTDQESGMPESGLRPLATNASGLRSSVGELEKSLRENQQLLTAAVQNSRSATQSDRNALGVGQIAGTVKLAEAGRLLAEAREFRARLTIEQGRLLAVAAAGAAVGGEKDRHAGLDVVELLDVLDDDLEEFGAALAEAQAQVDRLRTEVSEREQALAAVRSQLDQVRGRRMSLEETGFSVGDDESFEAYRAEYLRLSESLRELEQREQLLAFGGVEGGSVAGDDLLQGEIQGGTTVVGLNTLQRKLALAEDQLNRHTRGLQALEDHKNLVTTIGAEARTWESKHATRLEALEAEAGQIRAGMDELASQALEQEEAALRSARDAASAFGSAKSAAGRWTGDARTLQGKKDPQRLNDRLKRIIADQFAGEAADSGQAQSNTLVGRILTERALGLGEYLDTLVRADQLMPDAEFDPATLQDALTQARDDAVTILNEAREDYERLFQKQSDTSWVHQASLATVYHLLWLIDEYNADQHRSNLLDQLGQTIANRQQSPYLQQQVALHVLLTGDVEPPRPDQPSDAEPDQEAPDETDDDSGGD